VKPWEQEPAILVVDDEPASVELIRITLGLEFPVHTATSGERALQILAEHPEIALAIIDQRMPGMTGTEFIQRTVDPYPNLVRVILTGFTDVESLIEAINAGRVYRYLTKPWKKDELTGVVRQGLELHRLAMDNLRLQEELQEANARLTVENAKLKREAKERHRFDEIVGSSPSLERMLGLLDRVVATDSTVLILGETGTGKELIARAIHYNSARAAQPFVTENCAAMATELLTSELFGHRKGSFTGAISDHRGLFQTAHNGTIFLDEVGDCSPELQARLLRVLDQGEIRRIGDERPIRVNVRVIAATNRDLEKEVAEGRFRKDLFYRLSVFTIHPPPLRERRDDIPQLVDHFLAGLSRERGRSVFGFTPEAIRLLCAYDFPGNIRELRNEVERAFALSDEGAYITADLLSAKFGATAPPVSADDANGSSIRSAVEAFEAHFLREALERNRGNQSATAREIGLSRRALIDKMQKYRIR
jgi:two-component system response regulator HupR/HoxA